MNNTKKIFNESSLREDIVKQWGEHGAHALIYDDLLKKKEGFYPEEYDKSMNLEVGKYLVMRKDGKLHFERYNGTRFAHNNDTIVKYYLPKISI